MPELDFQVEGAEAVPYAASPQLAFKLRVSQADEPGQSASDIHSVLLRCQVRLEPARRRYSPAEQARLFDLFGEPQRWGQTVRGMLWAQTSVVLPHFTRDVRADLPVPCTFDFNVAATKYFYALEDGEIPVCLLFSGTVFYAGDGGALQACQIPWEKEVNYRLPVSAWKRMMELYYPNTAWLCLRQDVFDRLYRYKSRRMMPTWEQALESLLSGADAGAGNGAAAGESTGTGKERVGP